MLHQKFREILINFQENYDNQQEYIQTALELYKTNDRKEFLKYFISAWLCLSESDISTSREYKDRCLFFLVDLAINIYMQNEIDYNFLNVVVMKILECSANTNMSIRFFSCKFIASLLENENINLGDALYDKIQELILERLNDTEVIVRVEAVRVLHRFQDPINNDCPIIMAFCKSTCDEHPLVRKEVIKFIILCEMSSTKIAQRVRDVNYKVRIKAFTKCSSMKPTFFKIYDRQHILLAGFKEKHYLVKKFFNDVLLPKWLDACNGNCVNLFTGIKLNTDENDAKTLSI